MFTLRYRAFVEAGRISISACAALGPWRTTVGRQVVSAEQLEAAILCNQNRFRQKKASPAVDTQLQESGVDRAAVRLRAATRDKLESGLHTRTARCHCSRNSACLRKRKRIVFVTDHVSSVLQSTAREALTQNELTQGRVRYRARVSGGETCTALLAKNCTSSCASRYNCARA